MSLLLLLLDWIRLDSIDCLMDSMECRCCCLLSLPRSHALARALPATMVDWCGAWTWEQPVYKDIFLEDDGRALHVPSESCHGGTAAPHSTHPTSTTSSSSSFSDVIELRLHLLFGVRDARARYLSILPAD